MTIQKPKHKSKSKLKCKYCGKLFEVPNWRVQIAKYCSYDCSNKGRTTSKAYSKPRICGKCGKEYLPTSWNQKYCSRHCFLLSVQRRGKRECSSCGKSFIQTRVSQKYCSRKCAEPYNKKPTKTPKGYLDFLWGDLVKLLAGLKCECCSRTDTLNSHHIYSKSRASVRWDPDNGICLCASHHILGNFSAHKSPIDFVEWLQRYRGDDWFNKLREKANVTVKHDKASLHQIVVSLKEQIKEHNL